MERGDLVSHPSRPSDKTKSHQEADGGRIAGSICNFTLVTALGHLADGFVLELGGKSLLTHGTPSDRSMLAIHVSSIPGEVQTHQVLLVWVATE